MSHPQDRPPDIVETKMRQLGDDLSLTDLIDKSFVLKKVEVDLDFFEGRVCFEYVISKKEWETLIATMYKRKGKKVLPVNIPLKGGEPPGGSVNGEDISNCVTSGEFKPKIVPRGSRLTPERLAAMKIGTEFLSDAEKQLFIDILFEYEGAIAFDDSEMGLLNLAIEPPVHINTVPHVPWQQQNLRLPKAMQEAATTIIKEKLKHGTLEHSQGPYRSRYFLVEKHVKDTYRLINDVQPLNKVTIRELHLPL